MRELIKMYEWKLDMLRVELKSYQEENHSKDLLVDVSVCVCVLMCVHVCVVFCVHAHCTTCSYYEYG